MFGLFGKIKSVYNENKMALEGMKLYKEKFQEFLSDDILSLEEKNKLSEIIKKYNLTEIELKHTGKDICNNYIKKISTDKRISQQQMDTLKDIIDWTKTDVEELKIMFIENNFKLLLSYTLSKNFGVHQDDYLSKKNYIAYRNNLKFEKIKTNIEKIYIQDNIYNIPQPTRHYVNTHNHIPAWILLKNISFSKAINLFALLKPTEKREIVNAMIPKDILYKEKVEFLLCSLNLLRKFRNQIAHNLKFVTYKSPKTDTLSPNILTKLLPIQLISWKDINKQSRGLNDIYANILLIIYLLKDKYLITAFCNEVFSFISPLDDSSNEKIKSSLFQEYATITNIPYDLPNRITSYKNNLI